MASASKKKKIAGLTGGFQPRDTLHSAPEKTSQAEASTASGPHLNRFLDDGEVTAKLPKRPMLRFQPQKRASEEVSPDQPPRKKQAPGDWANADDILEDLPPREAEGPTSHAKRARPPNRSYHEHQRPDRFNTSKHKTIPDNVADSETEDEASPTVNRVSAVLAPTIIRTTRRVPSKSSGSPGTANIPKTTFVGAKGRLKISRACCQHSTYNAEGEDEQSHIYLYFKEKNLLPCNGQGLPISNYTWLEVKPAIVKEVEFCPEFSPVLISRSSGVGFGPKLHLEFASPADHAVFWTWIRDSKTGKAAGVKLSPTDW